MTTLEEVLKMNFDTEAKRFFFSLKGENAFSLEGIPKEAIIEKTFIMKILNEPNYTVASFWKLPDDIINYGGNVDKEFTEEELRKTFPQFFERKGELKVVNW